MPPYEPVRPRPRNLRGFEVGRPRGPAPGGQSSRTSERGKQIEAAEKELSEFLRGYDGLFTPDMVLRGFIGRLEQRGVTDYYVQVHGVGSAAANAWLPKFYARWGFAARPTTTQWGVTRNGCQRRAEIFTCWRKVQRLERALLGASPAVEYVCANMDETGMYRNLPERLVIAHDQMNDRGHLLAFERGRFRHSLGLTVTSDDQFAVPPLILIHRCRVADKLVLIYGLWSRLI